MEGDGKMKYMGFFSKELHNKDMIEHDFQDVYDWVDYCDGKQVVFRFKWSYIGTIYTTNIYGQPIKIKVVKDWCKDIQKVEKRK